MSLASTVLAFSHRIAAIGPLAPVVYVVFLGMWIVLCLPCTPLEIVPGFLFGFRTGWFVSVCGKSLGSLLSMIIGRYLLREHVERFIFSRWPVVRKFGLAIEKEGFSALVLIRGMPLAMGLKNYGLSVLRGVSIQQAMIAGSITAIPHSFIWATIGASAKDLAELTTHEVSVWAALEEMLPGPAVWFVVIVVLVASARMAHSLAVRFRELMDKVDDHSLSSSVYGNGAGGDKVTEKLKFDTPRVKKSPTSRKNMPRPSRSPVARGGLARDQRKVEG